MKRAMISAVAVLVLGWAGGASAQPDFEGLGLASGGPAPQQLPVQMPSQIPAQFPAQFPGQAPAQFPAQLPAQLPPTPGKFPAQVPPTPGKVPAGAPVQPADGSGFEPAPPVFAQPAEVPTYPRNTWTRRSYGGYRGGFNQGGSWNGARWYDYQGNHGGWGYAYRPIYQPVRYASDWRYGWDPRSIPYDWRDRYYGGGYGGYSHGGYGGYSTICYW